MNFWCNILQVYFSLDCILVFFSSLLLSHVLTPRKLTCMGLCNPTFGLTTPSFVWILYSASRERCTRKLSGEKTFYSFVSFLWGREEKDNCCRGNKRRQMWSRNHSLTNSSQKANLCIQTDTIFAWDSIYPMDTSFNSTEKFTRLPLSLIQP